MPELDYLAARDVGLDRVHDSRVQRWAAENLRVLISHDEHTMPTHFADLLDKKETSSGLIVVTRRLSILRSIEELEVLIVATDIGYWHDHYQLIQ